MGGRGPVLEAAIAYSTVAFGGAFCGAVGVFFALFPDMWMSIFTTDQEIIRIGVSYLQIVGPSYGLYGFGIGMYFACQGYGKLPLAVGANAIRLLMAAGGGLLAMSWIGTGPAGVFVAIACGFVGYAVLTTIALSRIRASGSAT
jgi:MATE family, multidrug efflux pump